MKMARLVPDPIPSTVLENPFRSTEIKVYRALGEQLESPFVVYYSRPWLGLNEQGAEREGEADFVVAHPEFGALVIEVKGGRIIRDGGSDHWWSTDRFGVRHEIRNPVDQANRSKHALAAKLRTNPRLRGKEVRLAHGIILPDVRGPGSDLGIDMPESIFAFADDMNALRNWVIERCSRVNPGANISVLRPEGMAALDDLLARSFTLHPSLRAALQADDRRIAALTQDQFHLLEQIASVTRARITGGAGTGKTLLALEKAHRLADVGQSVLLACVSIPLASHLRSLCAGIEGIHCHAIGELAEARPPLERGTSGRCQSGDLAARLLTALSRESGSYDAVILDEGQDVTPDVLQTLELALKSPRDGTFYVFFDDCQRTAGPLAATPGHGTPLRLGRNLRNTKLIFAVAKAYYRGSITGHGPAGVPVEWVELAGPGKWVSTVESRVGQLLGKDAVPAADIAILTGSEAGKRQLQLTSLRSHLRLSSSTSKDGISLESVSDFKGLERPVVLLCDIEPILDEPEALYVALTRARVHLIILGTRTQLATVDLGGTRPRTGEPD